MAQNTERLQALDALRGIAAVGVMLFHYIPYFNELFGHSFTPWSFLEFGRYGVHLFFILSGFVIFMTLERTPTAKWFGLARAFRLLPSLWAGIILTSIFVHLLGPESRLVSFPDALVNATLLHEYFELPHVDGAYWSLVVEATFYVWMAILFYGLGQGQKLRVVLWASVIGSYFAVIYWKAIPDGLEFLIKDLLFTKYAPLFISGMLLFRWHKHGTPSMADRLLLVVAMAHCLVAYKSPFNFFVVGCYATFIMAVMGYLNFLANRPLLLLGRLSYALYLVHQNIGYGIIQLCYDYGLPGQVGVMVAIAVVVTLAYGIHTLIEQPALRWFRQYRKTSMDSDRSAPAPLQEPKQLP